MLTIFRLFFIFAGVIIFTYLHLIYTERVILLKKKRLPLIITLIVVIFAAAALAILWYTAENPDDSDLQSGNIDIQSVSDSEVTSSWPIQKSDIENIYYSMSPDSGEVKFFEYSDSKLTEIEPTGKKTITAKVSGQQITADITYVERGEEITGYGLFLNDGTSGVYFYDYFFLKFKTLPVSHQVDEGDVLLLMDEDKGDFYSPFKCYEQSFYYNMDNGEISRFMNNATDSADLEGKKRSDYAMVTDEVLDSAGESIVFFTSRYYPVTDPDLDVDLDTKTKAVYNRLVTHAHFMYAKSVEDGTVFLRENSEGTGFSSILIPGYGKEEQVIKEFSGSYETDYIRSGDYLVNINTGVVTSLLTGEEITLNNPGVAKIEFFAISSDGTKAVIAGTPSGTSAGEQSIAFFDIESGRVRFARGAAIYTPMNPNFTFGEDYLFFSYPAPGDDIVYTGAVYNWSDIFSAKVN